MASVIASLFSSSSPPPPATTNAIESLLSRTRHVKRTVKRWRGETMVLRWVTAGVLEAKKWFRRVKGCQDMLPLVAGLCCNVGRWRLVA